MPGGAEQGEHDPLPPPGPAKSGVGRPLAGPVGPSTAERLPGPPSGSADDTPVEPPAPALPAGDGSATPAIAHSRSTAVETGSETWYRTERDRAKSVHRRANPWHRQMARAAIGVILLGGIAVGALFGAQAIRAAFDREGLPAIGADTPTIRSTSFEVRSSPPSPGVDGTLTLDTETGAFEFVGRGGGPQAGTQVTSPDGGSVFVRRDSGTWQLASTTDSVALDVQKAAVYLADDDSADDVLTVQLRKGFIDLVSRTEIGTGDDQVVRYELELDTRRFRDDFPLQFQDLRDRAIPGVESNRRHPITIWLDADDVLVQVRDEQSGWSWERLAHSDEPFVPVNPLDDLLTNTTADG